MRKALPLLFPLFVALSSSLAGCALWPGRTPPGSGLSRTADLLADDLLRSGEGRIAWLGFQGGDPGESDASEIVDEFVLSALLEKGADLMVPDTLSAQKWLEKGEAPCAEWPRENAPEVAFGRIEEEGDWMYLRLFLADAESGHLLALSRRRIAGEWVKRQVAFRRQRERKAKERPPLGVEFHLLALRDEGGFARPVPVEEGENLRVGDRIQVRFRLERDCQVYAFLYREDGARDELFPEDYVYSGRWQYGPGENEWFDLKEVDRVYTLYFVAGDRLPDDWEDLWKQMAEPVDQGKVERFTGWELLDRILAGFLQREYSGRGGAAVLRGKKEIGKGENRRFVLADGTTIENRGEVLKAFSLLVRAVGFGVQ